MPQTDLTSVTLADGSILTVGETLLVEYDGKHRKVTIDRLYIAGNGHTIIGVSQEAPEIGIRAFRKEKLSVLARLAQTGGK